MKLFSRKGILTVPPLSSVATIGFFDGVHLGHRFLLDTVLSASASRGLHSMAVTFPQSPFSVLHPESDVRLLSTSEEKVERLLDAGIDVVAMLPFTKELASLSSESFMSDILLRELHVKALVTGYDHHFGHGGNSSFEDYQRYGSAIGMEVIQASRLNQDGLPMSSPVSSSLIRQFLEVGELDKANQALGYAYQLSGQVVKGYHVGTQLGYPTANIAVSSEKLIPAHGVYAVRISSDLFSGLRGMLNIGHRPTVHNGDDLSIEVHIFDYSEDLYGHELTVSLERFIRRERKFHNLDELRAQLESDELECRK